MAANSQPKDPCDDGGSTSSSSDPTCPCKVVKKGNPIFVHCEEKSCKNKWWHATCAGFKNPKKAAINAVGDWMCPTCVVGLLPKSPATKIPGNQAMVTELVKMRDQFNVDFDKINSQISTLSKNLQKFDSAQENLMKSSDHLSNIMEKPKFSQLFSNSEENGQDLITTVAKQVINNHKKLGTERETREKNIILFNAPKEDLENSDQDVNFFQTLCKDVLDINEPPEVKMSRIGSKKPDKVRPIKVSFSQSWDKRIFLSKLPKLKGNSDYKKLHIAHDMCLEDRMENKALLKKAYDQNNSEQPKDFKYKVRGPPWNMNIIKVPTKN